MHLIDHRWTAHRRSKFLKEMQEKLYTRLEWQKVLDKNTEEE